MGELSSIAVGVEICLLPLLGVSLLVIGKVSTGKMARGAECMFMAVLLLATLATFRTLLGGQPQWLMHALTMAVMIVGAVSVPVAGTSRLESALR